MITAQVVETASKGIAKFAKDSAKAEERGIRKAGLALWQDALTQSPTPPILTGFLRGSAFMFHGMDKVKTVRPATDGKMPPDANPSDQDRRAVYVGFSAPYARKMHEEYEKFNPGPFSIQAGNVGAKFLTSKLTNNADRYKKLIAEEIEKLFK